MKLLLIIMLLCGSGHGKKPTQTAATIELNTCYDDKNQVCFSQILFWRWSHDYIREDIASWAIVNDTSRVSPSPSGNGWIVDFDGWKVWAPSIRTTHTHSSNDPERVNRKLLPEKERNPIIINRRP